MVLVAGAGLSKWAADLPLVHQLFDFGFQPFGVRESNRLDRVRAFKDAWDVAHPKGHTEEFIADVLGRGGPSSTDIVWYIARRLADPYIWQEWHTGRTRRHVLSIDENRKNARPGVGTIRAFVERLTSSGLSAVLTTNYDMLFEYALGTRRFNYGAVGERLSGRGPYPLSTYLHPVDLRGRLSLLKLHGSLSWRADGRFTDGRGALTGNALIVPPVHEKSMPPLLRDIWSDRRLWLRL